MALAFIPRSMQLFDLSDLGVSVGLGNKPSPYTVIRQTEYFTGRISALTAFDPTTDSIEILDR